MQKIISFNKFLINFNYFKIKSGSYITINVFNPLLRSLPNFGLKVNKLDFKKLIGTPPEKLDLYVLKAFRRIDKILYRRLTYSTEVQFNILINKSMFNDFNVFPIITYRRSSNFQILTGRCLVFKKLGSIFSSIKMTNGYTKSVIFIFNNVLFNRVVILV